MGQAERDIGMKPLTCLGERHLPVRAREQRHTKICFQIADGIGYGSLRHAEFLRGSSKAFQASGAFKNDQISGGWKKAAQVSHKPSLCKPAIFSSVTKQKSTLVYW